MVTNLPNLSLVDKACLSAAIARDTQLVASAVRVATALLFSFHNTASGQCNPTYETLAKASALGRRATINAVSALKREGWLSVRKGRSSNQFIFDPRNSGERVFTARCTNAHPSSEPAFTPACSNVHPSSAPVFTQNTGIEHRKGTQEENTGKRTHTVACATKRDFDDWYATYPRKANKVKALQAYKTARKKANQTTLLADAKRAQSRFADTDEQFIPYPATWLNQECWLDEDTTKKWLSRAEDPIYRGVL